MENNVKNKLMDIRKRNVLLQTVSSYTKTLSDLFVSDLSLFNSVCDNYDLTSEELLEMLEGPSYKNMAFYDEIIQYCYRLLDNKVMDNKELNR